MAAVVKGTRARIGRAAYLGLVALAFGFLFLPRVIVVLASINAGE
jgi:hypothetical protein